MHVLMIAPEDCPVPGGGSVAVAMSAIARCLAKRHRVTIICAAGRTNRDNDCDGNLHIVRIGHDRAGAEEYIGSVLERMDGGRYTCIQIDNRPRYVAPIKAAFRDVPVMLFLHSLSFVPRTSIVAAGIDAADLIIANSRSLQRRLIRRFPAAEHKIRVVHLGVDTARFKLPSPAEKRQWRQALHIEDEFTVLFVGRVIPRKGVPVLIEAMRIAMRDIPAAKLVIVGKARTSYARSLQAQADRLGVPAVFAGRIPHAQIHRMFGMADCFVCPSQKHEAFGLVNVEALASGLPVIASNIGGIGEIVTPGCNGYLVDHVAAPESFAAYLAIIASDGKLAAKLSRQGRASVVRRFGWGRTARKLAALYAEAAVKLCAGEAEVHTTGVEVYTMEEEVYTTEAGVYTTEAEVYTTEAGVYTTEAEVYTTEAERQPPAAEQPVGRA